MPELPEVEVTRRSFADRIAGARILHLRLGKPLRWPLGVRASSLVGRTVGLATRRGKYLWLPLDNGDALLGHLGHDDSGCAFGLFTFDDVIFRDQIDGMLSVTQATEVGTVYSLAEVRELVGEARRFGLRVHMDGARFANAVAALVDAKDGDLPDEELKRLESIVKQARKS